MQINDDEKTLPYYSALEEMEPENDFKTMEHTMKLPTLNKVGSVIIDSKRND